MAFENLIGNEEVKRILKQTIESQKVLHSYLFLGKSGIGRFHFAKEFAKMILCMQQENSPCSHCKSCIEFDSENHPDFQVIRPDGNAIKIEQIRQMSAKVIEKPIIAEKKVYLIDQSDKMTKEAQNCLLKTLEEPPSYIVILLIAENESLILNTIKSRCTKVNFKPIPDKELENYLEQECQMGPVTESQLQMYGGSIGKALALKDKIEDYKVIEKIFASMPSKDLVEILNQKSELTKNKEEIFEVLDYIIVVLFHLSKNKHQYMKGIPIVEDTKQRLKQNSNFDMCMDHLLLRVWEEVRA